MSLSSARIRFSALCVAALLCWIPAARADDAEATIRLKHLKPSAFTRLILAPSPAQTDATTAQSARIEGLKSVAPDDAASSVTIRGDKAGIEQAKALARLMDVAVPTVRLKARILRYSDDKYKKPEVIATAVGEAEPGKFCELKVSGGERLFLMRFRPQVSEANLVSLTSDVTMTQGRAEPNGAVNQWSQRLQGVRSLPAGKSVTVLRFTNQDFRIASGSENAKALYIEVTPEVRR